MRLSAEGGYLTRPIPVEKGPAHARKALGMSASTAPDTVVLIHGLWLTARSWEHWIHRYESVGYRVLAPNWPGMAPEVEALNADPTLVATLTVEHIVDRCEEIVLELQRPPIIMGHSLGGTFAQILLDQGLGAAGIGVASPAVGHVRDIPLTTIKVVSPALNPFRKGKSVALTANEFHYAFANTLSRAESDALHARYAVPAPGALLSDHAFTRFRRDTPLLPGTQREPRAPLLFIAFGEDHAVPADVVRQSAMVSDDAGAITEYVEFPGRPHFPTAPGWEEVADHALMWASTHAQGSVGTTRPSTTEEKGESS
jgi:pimeloyl-ACP methyl ester carboxylesterase